MRACALETVCCAEMTLIACAIEQSEAVSRRVRFLVERKSPVWVTSLSSSSSRPWPSQRIAMKKNMKKSPSDFHRPSPSPLGRSHSARGRDHHHFLYSSRCHEPPSLQTVRKAKGFTLEGRGRIIVGRRVCGS